MKKFCLIFILLLSFGLFADKPKLAVMNFTDETEGRLSKDLVRNGSKLIRARFTRHANSLFDIVTDQENEAALREMKKKSHETDRDRSFQIELGKQVSAAKIVISTIGSLDATTFLITSTLVDVKRGVDETAADAIFDGSAKSLIDAVDEIIKQLLGDVTDLAKEEAEAEARKKEQARLESAKAKLELKKIEEESHRRVIEERRREDEYDRKTRGYIEWSSSYSQNVTWNEARQYCENLQENGHDDWRLPTIDDWRSTFQNCPVTQPGGKCQVSGTHGRLDPGAFSRACKAGCRKGYSTQTGKGWFWSSSGKSGTNHFWVIALKNARISSLGDNGKGSVRCVR